MQVDFLTLQKPTSITKAIIGNFRGLQTKDIVHFANSYITLQYLDQENQEIITEHTQNLFGLIKNISTLSQKDKDYILLTSDSGKLSVLEYRNTLYAPSLQKTSSFTQSRQNGIQSQEQLNMQYQQKGFFAIQQINVFQNMQSMQLQQQNGARFLGDIMASSLNENSCVIGGYDGKKQGYLINRDKNEFIMQKNSGQIQHINPNYQIIQQITIDLIALNHQHLFASLELLQVKVKNSPENSQNSNNNLESQQQQQQQQRSYDSLNEQEQYKLIKYIQITHFNVKTRQIDIIKEIEIDADAYRLITIPHNNSQILLVCHDYIILQTLQDNHKDKDHPSSQKINFPQRITNHPDFVNKMHEYYPDLPKNNLNSEENIENPSDFLEKNDANKRMIINDFCFEAKELHHAHESGYILILQNDLGDLFKVQLCNNKQNLIIQYVDTIPVGSSLLFLPKNSVYLTSEKGNHYLYQMNNLLNLEKNDLSLCNINKTVSYYYPHQQNQQYLIQKQQINNFSVISDFQLKDLKNEGQEQLYIACAAGRNSCLRILRQGLPVSIVGSNEFQEKPLNIYPIFEPFQMVTTQLLISFQNSTKILQIDNVVEITTNHPYATDQPTVYFNNLIDFSKIQVLKHKILLFNLKRDPQNHKQLIPSENEILQASSNLSQLLTVQKEGELSYYQYQNQQLQLKIKKKFESDINSLQIPQQQQSSYAAIGLQNLAVYLVSLQQNDQLCILSYIQLPQPTVSLAFIEQEVHVNHYQRQQQKQVLLWAGTEKGQIHKMLINKQNELKIHGQPEHITTESSVRLVSNQNQYFQAKNHIKSKILALSSKSFLFENNTSEFEKQPLAVTFNMQKIVPFFHPEMENGWICVTDKTLNIIEIEKQITEFDYQTIPLTFSPRKLCLNIERNNLLIIESNQKSFNRHIGKNLSSDVLSIYQKVNKVPLDLNLKQVYNNLVAPYYIWGSVLRIFDAKTGKSVKIHDFTDNEHAVSLTILENQQYLIVGTVQNYINSPKKYFSKAYLCCYQIIKDGQDIELLHKTEVQNIPNHLENDGKLVFSVQEQKINIYKAQKDQLYLINSLQDFSCQINSLKLSKNIMYIGTLGKSIQTYTYKTENVNSVEKCKVSFTPLCSQMQESYIQNINVLDQDLMIVSDKYENIQILKIPDHAYQQMEDMAMYQKIKIYEKNTLLSPFQLSTLAHIFVGDLITSIHKTKNSDLLLMTGAQGGIYAINPTQDQHIKLLNQMQQIMNFYFKNLCGGSQQQYRSYYYPIQNVIDQDFIQMYNQLPTPSQEEIIQFIQIEKEKLSEENQPSIDRILQLLEQFKKIIL